MGCFFPFTPFLFLVRFYITVTVFIFLAVAAGAQKPYSLVHYDETRLPQTSIGSIQQDKYGYLWMNSQYGIVRFDGANVRSFTTGNLRGLQSNRIRLCAKSSDGSIYFVDENHIILKLTGPNTFEVMSSFDAVIKKGGLPLYASEPNSDFVLMPVDKGFDYNRFTDAFKLDKQREIVKVYTTGNGSGCFFYLDLQGHLRVCFFNGPVLAQQRLPGEVRWPHIFKLNNQVFWQKSASEAYLFKNAETMQPVKIIGLPKQYAATFLQDNPVVFCNETGTFFYAAGQLYRYNWEAGNIVATLLFDGLPCSGVTNVMQEKNTGYYFISTQSEGFYQVKEKRFGVLDLNEPDPRRRAQTPKVNNNIAYALQFWDKDHLFVDGYRKAINDSSFAESFFPVNYTHYNLYFLYKKDSTHLWVDNESWVLQLDTKTRSSTRLFQLFNPKKALPLSGNTTLILGIHKIVAWDGQSVTEMYSNDSLNFTTIEKVDKNCLAVGSQSGLYLFYPARKKLQLLPYKEELKVRSIVQDHAGKVWFTTYGQGLFYLSGNRILSLPLDNNRYLSISHSMVQDRNGDFWVTTNHGLFKLRYSSLLDIISGKNRKLYYTYYDKTDGFNTNEFNGGCSPSGLYQPETGSLFFPSMDGVVTFKPDSVTTVSQNYPVYFDEVVRNDTGRTELLNQPLFDKHTSSLRLFFSSPYYGNPANIKYSYALSTAPTEWREVDNSGSVLLSNLPGGTYTVWLKKEEAASAPVTAAFSFEIEKKFSETIWFKLLLLVAVVALVFLYFRARLFYLKKERDLLEREVAQRTTDQTRLIGELNGTVKELTQVQQELSQMITHRENIVGVLIHDIKSPLRFLNTVSAHLAGSLQQADGIKNKEIASEIATSLNRLYLFVQDFAIWLGFSTPGRLLVYEQTDLHRLLTETVAVYREGAASKGVHIQLPASAPAVYSDSAMLKSVLRNLLDNAVKNTDAGLITVEAACSPDLVCYVTIQDEGKGLPEERIEELNHYFRSEQETLSFSSERSGHKIIKDFLQKLDGHIYYRRNSPNGLVVTVTLPTSEPVIPDNPVTSNSN